MFEKPSSVDLLLRGVSRRLTCHHSHISITFTPPPPAIWRRCLRSAIPVHPPCGSQPRQGRQRIGRGVSVCVLPSSIVRESLSLLPGLRFVFVISPHGSRRGLIAVATTVAVGLVAVATTVAIVLIACDTSRAVGLSIMFLFKHIFLVVFDLMGLQDLHEFFLECFLSMMFGLVMNVLADDWLLRITDRECSKSRLPCELCFWPFRFIDPCR